MGKLALLAVLIQILSLQARAASTEVVIQLPEIEGTYPPGATRHFVDWDTGVAFSEVHEIAINFQIEGTSGGVCYGYPTVCTPSSSAHARIYTDESNRPSYAISIGVLSWSGYAASRLYSGPSCVVLNWNGECISWRDIDFREGRGVLEFDFSLDELRSPGAISDATLVVTGIAVPEPKDAQAAALLILFFLRSLRGRGPSRNHANSRTT